MKMTQNRSRIADGAWNLPLSFLPSVLLLAVVINLKVVIWCGLLGFYFILCSGRLSVLFATLIRPYNSAVFPFFVMEMGNIPNSKKKHTHMSKTLELMS